MKLTAEWGLTPTSSLAIQPVVFGSMEIENANLRAAKGHIFKHVKTEEQVIEAFSSPGQPWIPSEAKWGDWSPTQPVPKQEGFLFTERVSEDVCFKRIGTESCVLFIRLTWQEVQVAEETAEIAEEAAE